MQPPPANRQPNGARPEVALVTCCRSGNPLTISAMTQKRIDNEARTILGIVSRLGCALLLLAPIGLGAPRAEQPYPVRPIRLVEGFGAGGPTDIPAPSIAEKLAGALGQRGIVENKPAAPRLNTTRHA